MSRHGDRDLGPGIALDGWPLPFAGQPGAEFGLLDAHEGGTARRSVPPRVAGRRAGRGRGRGRGSHAFYAGRLRTASRRAQPQGRQDEGRGGKPRG